MTDTLAELTDKVQAALGDDGTLFTDALVTAAARRALRELNEAYPLNSSVVLDAVTDQHEYSLSDYEEELIDIIGVWLWDDDGDAHEPIAYDFYQEDGFPMIRLRTAESDGEYLLVRYTQPFEISGLDGGAAAALIPAWLDPLLVDGIAYHSVILRGLGGVESNNLNASVADDYREYRNILEEGWTRGLRKLAARRPPVSEKDDTAWRDEWEGWRS